MREKKIDITQLPSGYIYHQRQDDGYKYIMIMKKDGNAFARIYWDSEDYVVLDSLSVDESVRKQGIGRELQEIREDISRLIGIETSYLWVEKDSWMHGWYERRGYKDEDIYEEVENTIWMSKTL